MCVDATENCHVGFYLYNSKPSKRNQFQSKCEKLSGFCKLFLVSLSTVPLMNNCGNILVELLKDSGLVALKRAYSRWT